MRNSILFIICMILMMAGCGKRADVTPDRVVGYVSSHLNTGRMYLNQSRYDLAEMEFQKVLQKQPQNTDAQVGLGLVYMARGDLKRSKEAFAKVARLEPQYAAVYNYLGIIYSEEGRYFDAKKMFLKAINSSLYRTPELAYLNLCQLELKNNNLKNALRYATAGLEIDDKYAPLYYVKGLVYHRSGMDSKAVFYFEQADEYFETPNLDCLIKLAESYYNVGKLDEALNALDRALGVADSREAMKQISDLQKKINDQL